MDTEWTEEKEYTAWDLGADWSWQTEFRVRLPAGRTLYDCVNIGKHEGVRLERVDGSRGLRGIARYVSPDTKLVLVSSPVSGP
jgi:hypothetical protein